MATEYLPNQPISFINDLDTCASPTSKYVQIADINDVNQFQFKVTYCDTSCNDIFNYGEISLGEDWSYTIDGYCKAGLGTSSLQIPMADITTGLTYIKVTILSINGTLELNVAGNDAAELLGYISAPGTYEFYINVQTTYPVLYFNPVTTETTACVDLTTGLSLACPINLDYVVQIRDTDGNYIATVSPLQRTVSSNYLTYSLNWANLGITSGCVTVCIADPCLNTNGQFDNPLNDITPSEVNSGGSGFITNPDWVNFYYADEDEFGTGELTYDINPGLSCYNICFTISPASAGARMKIVNGLWESSWISSPDDYCINIPAYDNSYPLILSFESFYNDEAIHLVEVFNLTMTACNQSYICDCCSAPIKIGSYECTHVVKSYCDKDALGFKFCNSTFVPQIRLSSKLVRASYQTTRESFEDSAGNKNTIYFKRRRSKNFRVDPAVAEYVHDYLSTLSGYDHMFIDNHEYFVDDDEYQVSYPSRNDIEAIVSINVSEKVQLTENKNCGSDCTPTYEWPTTAKSCNC
jgi:hypothetical protein